MACMGNLVNLFQTDLHVTTIGQPQAPLTNAMARWTQHQMRFHSPKFG